MTRAKLTRRGAAPQAAFFPLDYGPDWLAMQMHGSCACRAGDGVLLTGASGAGKSDLLLRLLARGFDLVADDQVEITDGIARPLPALAGLLEVRGLGIFRMNFIPHARLALVVQLGSRGARLPALEQHEGLRLPTIALDASAVSAAERVVLALDCVLGRVTQVTGAFAQ